MKFKTLLITLLFAVSMWAQTATPAPADQAATKATASCCKDGADCCKGKVAKADCCKEGAQCCKAGAACCNDKMANADCCKEGAECCKAGADCCAKTAKANAKDCCGGKMCKRHKA